MDQVQYDQLAEELVKARAQVGRLQAQIEVWRATALEDLMLVIGRGIQTNEYDEVIMKAIIEEAIRKLTENPEKMAEIKQIVEG